MKKIVFRQCTNPICNLRFPDYSDAEDALFCPNCGSKTIKKLFPKENFFKEYSKLSNLSLNITVVLDNIRSAYNVGSIIRTCEVFKVKKVFLGGITPGPDNPKVLKTSLGSEKTLVFQSTNNCIECVKMLKVKKYLCYGLEISNSHEKLNDLNVIPSNKIVLILGNEHTGIDPDLMEMCDRIVEIPIYGDKESLNVTVACGIALYHFRSYVKTSSA